MARVPLSISPDTSPPATPPPDYQHIDSSPADFGGLIGQSEQKFGEDASKAGNNMTDAALLLQGRHNQVVNDDTINSLMDQTRGIVSNFKALTGADAATQRTSAAQAVDDARTTLRGNLQNDAQRLEFDQASRRYQYFANQEIDNHAIQQTQVYHADVAKAGMSNALQDIMASPFDDTKFMNSVAEGSNRAGKMADTLAGATAAPEVRQAHVQAFISTAVKTRFQAMMPTDPARAASFLEANRANLDGNDFATLSREAQTFGDTAFARTYVNGLLGPAGVAPPAPHTPPGGGANTAPIANTTLPGEAQTFLPALSGGEGNYNSPAPAGDRSDTPIRNNRYQFLSSTWNAEAPKAGVDVSDRSPAAQDKVAWNYAQNVYRANTGGDLQADIRSGVDPAKIAGALNKVWPSLPGGSEQNTTMAQWTQRLNGMAGNRAGPTGADAVPITSATPPTVAGTPGSSPAYPDESALVKRALADTAGMPPDRQAKVVGQLTRQLSLVRLATDTDRMDLQKSLPDLQAAALGGRDVVIPEQQIRHLLPPAEAAREIENLTVAQQAGQVFKGIQWGTPDQVEAARQDLSSGLGPISAMIRAKGQPTAPAGTAAPGSDQDSPEAYRLRVSILDQFKKQVQTRDAALSSDPAGYVAAAPTVAAAAQAIKAAPDDPAALAGYVTATQAVQTSLGVPEAQQHVLTAADAKTQARNLMSIDPSKGDMGQALAGVAQQYGAAWPKVFGDLVTLGKLSPEYQILAAMPDPVYRTDFQRALAATANKGGVAQLREDVPPQAVKDIDAGLDEKLADFRRSASVPGLSSNVALISTVRDSMKTLAYFYAMQGGDGPAALDRAYDAVLGSKYDFDGGTMRVPKGMLPAAETATANVQSSLKPADLLPLAADTMATPAGPGMTVAQRQAVTFDAARRGQWVPDERDAGLVLVGKLANGANIQLRRADGSRIEVPFKGIRDATKATAAAEAPFSPVPMLQ
jgi:hypothetical protein